MKAPTQPSDITKEWIQYMLTDYENRENSGTIVTVDSFESSAGSNIGEGYVGAIIKLNVKASLSKHSFKVEPGTTVIYQYDLAVKLKGEDPRTDFMFEVSQVYTREMLMYSKVLVEFDNFQKNRANNKYPISFPKFVYGKGTAEEFVLVMENIKDKGFVIHDKEKTLNFEHIKMAVTQLVRIHSISYSDNQSYPFLERHPEFKTTEYNKVFHKFMAPAFLDIASEILKKEKDVDLARKIQTNKKNILSQFHEALDENKYKLLCLIHGDFHARNFMFRYTEGDEKCEIPTDIKVLDWQLPVWNTPVMDLHYLIFTSTSREFRKQHLEDILKYYHTSFVEATSNMGVDELNWTYEDFKNEFKRIAFFGFSKGMHLTFGHHCPEFIQSNEDEKQKAINRPQFVKTLFSPLMKLIEKYYLSSTVDSMMNYAVKASMMPFIKTITRRENENLASRVLGLIYEAEENGLFG